MFEENEIKKMIDRRFENFESAMPGIISSVNNDGTVNVVPMIKKVATNGVIDVENLVILSVPLIDLGGAYCSIEIEPVKNDTVMLLAMSRDSGKWKSSDWKKPQTPNSCDGNNLNDFVAFLTHFNGSGGTKAKIKIASDGIVTINGHLEISAV